MEHTVSPFNFSRNFIGTLEFARFLSYKDPNVLNLDHYLVSFYPNQKIVLSAVKTQ